MSTKHNTKHHRNKSAYSTRNKANHADRYGRFNLGDQQTADKIGGATLWYPRDDEGNPVPAFITPEPVFPPDFFSGV